MHFIFDVSFKPTRKYLKILRKLSCLYTEVEIDEESSALANLY